MTDEKEIIPAHQWVNEDGEVLVVRFANRYGKSHGGFQHPMSVGDSVTAPDWDAEPVCGGGIHGWPLGLSMGDGKEPDWTALWQVYGVQPTDIVGNIEGGGKCKFRAGTLRYLGDWQGATNFALSAQIKWVHQASSGAASSTGDSGAAIATGLSSRARGGKFGCIALAWWNSEQKRPEMRCALTGSDQPSSLKENVWYRLNEAGEFVEVQE